MTKKTRQIESTNVLGLRNVCVSGALYWTEGRPSHPVSTWSIWLRMIHRKICLVMWQTDRGTARQIIYADCSPLNNARHHQWSITQHGMANIERKMNEQHIYDRFSNWSETLLQKRDRFFFCLKCNCEWTDGMDVWQQLGMQNKHLPLVWMDRITPSEPG